MSNFFALNNGKSRLKPRLPIALLSGFVPSFMFFFFGIIEIYYGNRSEFLFRFRDFGIWTTLAAIGAAALITLLVLFLPDKASQVTIGVATWLAVAGFIQSAFLNGSGTLSRDTECSADTFLVITDAAVWVILGIIIIGASLFMKKKSFIKPAIVIALIMVLVMSVTAAVIQLGNSAGSSDKTGADIETETSPFRDPDDDGGEHETESAETDKANDTGRETEHITETETDAETKREKIYVDPQTAATAYLTMNGLTQVSAKNIVVFVIDRFDARYYDRVSAVYPEIFDSLDGFTYFSDNISLYSRTYPAIPAMISGVDNDFSGGAEEYFEKAYQDSPFLNDLKDNGYAIKLYTQNFYCYRSGTPLVGTADNISVANEYRITDRPALVGDMMMLSAYKYLPNMMKDLVDVSSSSFSGIVSLSGNGELYETVDSVVCKRILGGLTFDNNGKSYTFIHLSGCHYPYSMDENCNYLHESTMEQSLRGCMKMIHSYIDDMKRLGVYDDATIIITGDHPAAIDDHAVPTQTRLTALFVKPSGSSGTPLKHSKAPVSQENLIPTIVKSAGIETDIDYGKSYFEVKEDEKAKRYHKFELSIDSNAVTQLVVFEINGDGTDFKNWKIKEYQDIGALYK